ncbi:nondiscriminating aspartyl-tRNA synthetase [Anaerosporobacter mobilis DSM 15930]|uniref:Aspartate--tRNA ligase n=2 Tax=Anaerosporobacter TaxID=653683 RepID=A0A1M7HSU0_9FIRM|nr:aspartate--tRNA(Asn) ligase [Anaerosporobacter mobilis]SHM31631.1 nondiscriminating aspartyl-tRNA synthetase [Anaerosporobacter mobilis DSM 15930]
MVKVNVMKEMTGIIEEKTIEPEQFCEYIGNTIKVHGSIYKIRKMSGFAFVLLRTKRDIIQCVYGEEFSSFSLSEIVEECCVIITADVVKEERSKTGVELRLVDVEVLSRPVMESPIVINNKKVDTSIENLLNYRPITLRNEKERAIFKIQEGLCQAFRTYLTMQRFTEIHTPKIVYAGAEGGANIFQLDYFGKKAYLAQSPQFYKQMMVGVYERVFEIAPVFRAEKHDTSRHINEYTSVDFEMGYIQSFEDIMQMETGLIQYAMRYLEDEYHYELELLKVKLPKVSEIPTIRFMEAKELIANEYHREMKDYEDFEPEEEKLLCEAIKKKTGSEFIFVTHYPTKKRPFYAFEDPEDQEVTLSFDLLFRGLEVTTGGQRIHNYDMQVAKMKERGMTVESFESYLMMHKYGMPPHGGLGLGLERFTSKLLLQDNVRLSTLFPRDINRVTP